MAKRLLVIIKRENKDIQNNGFISSCSSKYKLPIFLISIRCTIGKHKKMLIQIMGWREILNSVVQEEKIRETSIINEMVTRIERGLE